MIGIGSRIHGRVQMFKSIKKIKELLKKEDQELVNDSDNNVMISIQGDKIIVICKNQQMDELVERMSNDRCFLSAYEPWEDYGEETSYILTFMVGQDAFKDVVYN